MSIVESATTFERRAKPPLCAVIVAGITFAQTAFGRRKIRQTFAAKNLYRFSCWISCAFFPLRVSGVSYLHKRQRRWESKPDSAETSLDTRELAWLKQERNPTFRDCLQATK